MLVDQYLASWNETDPERRLDAIRSLWVENGQYRDPRQHIAGHQAINALIGGVQSQLSGTCFRLAGNADGYGDKLRFRWELIASDGQRLVTGTSFVSLGGADRIASLVDFLDFVDPVVATTLADELNQLIEATGWAVVVHPVALDQRRP